MPPTAYKVNQGEIQGNAQDAHTKNNLKYLQEIETLRRVLADFNKKRDESPIIQRDTSAIHLSKLNQNSSQQSIMAA